MNNRLHTVSALLCRYAFWPLLLAPLFFSQGARAQPQRMGIWLTGPIGATNAAHCQLDAPAMRNWQPADNAGDPSPQISEKDIATWDASNGRWTLDARTLDQLGGAIGITDQCFVLAIDGHVFAAGAVLSAFSARLLRFPIIAVEPRESTATFQLRGGFSGVPMPLGQAEFDRVLSTAP